MSEIDQGFTIKNESWDRTESRYREDSDPESFRAFDALSIRSSHDMGFSDPAASSTESVVIELTEGRSLKEPIYVAISYKDQDPVIRIAGIDIMTETPSYNVSAKDLVRIEFLSSMPSPNTPPNRKRTITPNSQGMGERGKLLH